MRYVVLELPGGWYLVRTELTSEELKDKVKYIASLFRQEGYEPSSGDVISELEERDLIELVEVEWVKVNI